MFDVDLIQCIKDYWSLNKIGYLGFFSYFQHKEIKKL